jgi:hypothetical protein
LVKNHKGDSRKKSKKSRVRVMVMVLIGERVGKVRMGVLMVVARRRPILRPQKMGKETLMI